MPNYYVSQWALRRKAEIIDIPEDFDIHPDLLRLLSKEVVRSAFARIHQMFHAIYQEIADHPELYKMPLVEIREDTLTRYGFPPPQAQTSKRAPYMPFDALINLLICGRMDGDELSIDVAKLRYANQNYKLTAYKAHSPKSYAVKHVDCLYAQLEGHGLYLEGLKNYKFTGDTGRIILRYPDSRDVLTVLKWMAVNAHAHERRQDFMVCHHRLLQISTDAIDYGYGVDYIADRMHTANERECANQLHAALAAQSYIPVVDNRGEPAGEDAYAIHYYARSQDVGNRSKSLCKLSSHQTKLRFSFRLRSIQRCAEHIAACSAEVQEVFIPGDKGCANRDGCKHGQAYTINGTDCWKCGCYGTMITLVPREEDITDYLKLVQMGMDKRA